MSIGTSFLGLVGALAITFGAASVASRFSPGGWYATLSKPAWNPPNWVFGPVWGILYILMAVAAWLVWRHLGFIGAAVPLTVYLLQLVLNAAWSWLFFGRQNLPLAFVEILALWLAILWTIILFWNSNIISGILLLPYLLWVTFASILNLSLWRLNPHRSRSPSDL
jgi:tryptophan-rich sensory protein